MSRILRNLALAACAAGWLGIVRPAAADETTASIAPASAAPAVPRCYADWSDAGPIVRREGLATIEKVGELARERASLEILTSTLCKTGERYVYRLTVRGRQGALRTLIVDARQPFDR